MCCGRCSCSYGEKIKRIDCVFICKVEVKVKVVVKVEVREGK